MSHRSSVAEEVPFLDSDSSTSTKEGLQNTVVSGRKSRWRVCSIWLLHLLLIFTNTVFFAANIMNNTVKAHGAGHRKNESIKPNYAGTSLPTSLCSVACVKTIWPRCSSFHWRKEILRCPAEPQDAPIEVNTVRWGLPIGKRTNFTSFDPEVADAAWATRGISHHRESI